MNPVLNLSAYKFVTLNDTDALRESIRSQASTHALKGTVLLAAEGINFFLAGEARSARRFLDWLRGDARFADLAPLETRSETVPFKRLRVKVKCEIIRMDSPAVRPETGRAPAVAAATLARWLAAGHDDAGRPVVALDARNAFEVARGRFASAIDWGLSRFSEFPAALAARKGELAGKTVVTYCTGGIRCEKAAILMREAGVERVFQLEGGILEYFEQMQGAPHWRGECFVFDERSALAPRGA